MSEWTARRFWDDVTVAPDAVGHAILLDGKPLHTPAKAPLVLPSRALADAVAAEWAAQEDMVAPHTMPFTRTANSAIDNVALNHAEIAAMIAEYGETDLLCYRAEGPAELIARQCADWDPLLDWAAEALDAPLATGVGVIHVPQPHESLARMSARVHALDPFRLAALHDLVALSGSLVIGLAALTRHRPPDALWALSRIDENWQAEQWGEDDIAAADAAAKRTAFLHAAQVLERLEST
ncbi:MAG: ATPase [Rhodobacteraceae bacterium]|nr:ATPase [Paracoccaceae bacterium]